MALLTAAEIRETGYDCKCNTVDKYYMNIPYKTYRNYKRLDVKSEFDGIMQYAYPYDVDYYYGECGEGYVANGKVIRADLTVTFRGNEYHIEYYTRGYYNNFEDIILVYGRIPVKFEKTLFHTKKGEKKYKLVPNYKTAVFINKHKYDWLLPVRNPKFEIDMKLVKYLLSINKETYGQFHRQVCEMILNKLNKENA